MKKPTQKHPARPAERRRLTLTSDQLSRLMEGMPERYRGFVRIAVEKKTPLSANGLSDVERMKVIGAFKKARDAASLPEMIFHDLTRATVC